MAGVVKLLKKLMGVNTKGRRDKFKITNVYGIKL